MLNGNAVESLVDPADAAGQTSLIYAEDLLTKRETRALKHIVVQKDVRGQGVLFQLAGERNNSDNRAVLVGLVV